MRPKVFFRKEWHEYRNWVALMALISVMYVLAEFAFNAALLNTSSGLVLDPDEFERVETAGRVLASFGFVLFIFSFLRLNRDGKEPFSFPKALKRLGVTTLLMGPLFYFTTDYLIDDFLVKPSSGEERWAASIADFVKRTEGSGISSFYGMRLREDEDPTAPERMTYHAMSSAIMLNDPQRLSLFYDQGMETFFNVYVGLRTVHSMDDAYASYLRYEKDLEDAWLGYEQASKKFHATHHGISDRDFDDLWYRIKTDLRASWAKLDKHLTYVRRFYKQMEVDPRSGYPVTVRTYSDFLNHPRTGQKVRAQIEEVMGFTLNSDFDRDFGGSPTTTRHYIDAEIRQQHLVAWRAKVAERLEVAPQDVMTLKPGLSFPEFIANQDIAKLIRHETDGMYSRHLRLNMSEGEFQQKVLRDIVNEERNAIWTNYQRPSQAYAGNGIDGQDGMSYYRSVVVPPIALGLSLFFSLVALLKLPLMLNEVIYANSLGKHDYRRWANGALMLGILVVLLVPFSTERGELHPSVQKTLSVLETAQDEWMVNAAHWIYVAEPKLYRLGQGLLTIAGLDNREVVTIYQQ